MNYKPHPDGIAVGRFFARAEVTNCTRIELHLEDFLPLQKLQTPPTPMELHLEDFSPLCKLQAPPTWNCNWTNAEITSPTRIELHSEDFLPLWKLLKNYKPHPNGIALGIFFVVGRITNPTWVELQLEDFSPFQKLQTPSGWNCTLKIFRPFGNCKPHPHGIALGRFFTLG
jgi:hypothetical protein